MGKSKLRVTEEREMRGLLDQYLKLVDKMMFKTNWEWCSDEAEITSCLIETKFIVHEFIESLARIKEKKNEQSRDKPHKTK